MTAPAPAYHKRDRMQAIYVSFADNGLSCPHL